METTQPATRAVEERYDIVRKLGEGASAETFLATDRDNRDEQVVIKSLHIEKLDGWKFFELFEREATTLAALDHPGVPDFIEWFASKNEDDRPRFHIVQEYIEGRPLSEIIEAGGMTEIEFDQLALGMLDILHYLHSRVPPVFHRDIKPSNIIVREMGAPVLVDFGSVTSGWRAEDDRGSTVAGTHGYMPPEQYMGQVSSRSDLYGLGATLLHVVSGRPPSDYSFDDGRINVPDDLPVRPAVLKGLDAMLEPAPRDRPQSAKEARQIFVSQASNNSTALVRRDDSTALARRGDVVRIDAGDAPKFVDLGPPPRDPDGEFADVYRSLAPPWYSLTMGVEGVNRNATSKPLTLQLVFFLFIFLSTFGLWPLTRLIGRNERKRRAELFETGVFSRAEIVGISSQDQQATRVSYTFDVDGETVQTSCLVASKDGSYFLTGDVLGVLYEPGNPVNNTLVYR